MFRSLISSVASEMVSWTSPDKSTCSRSTMCPLLSRRAIVKKLAQKGIHSLDFPINSLEFLRGHSRRTLSGKSNSESDSRERSS